MACKMSVEPAAAITPPCAVVERAPGDVNGPFEEVRAVLFIPFSFPFVLMRSERH